MLNAFRLARRSFGPDAKLMINDFSITSSNASTTQYLEIIELLMREKLIDVRLKGPRVLLDSHSQLRSFH